MAFALLVHSFIKKYLFSPFTVAIGLVLGALLMMAAERKIRGHEAELVQDVDHISLKQALYIGFYQFLSLWPGFSRSGSTIGGALLVGVSRKAGADFTFIMALPIMVAACLYELLKIFRPFPAAILPSLAWDLPWLLQLPIFPSFGSLGS